MSYNKLSRQLAKEAAKHKACKDGYNQLLKLDNKPAMVRLYLEKIDFCISNEYPSNAFIKEHFAGVMEDYGVFVDHKNINVTNCRKLVTLGTCNAKCVVDGYSTSQVFVKNESEINIIAKDNAFVMVDVFDDSVVIVTAYDKAKVCVNRYGGTINVFKESPTSAIKVREKNKKTY